MSVLGNVLVGLALLTAAVAALSFVRAAGGTGTGGHIPRYLVRAHLLLVTLASALLLGLIVSHDFSVGYVFGYSDRSLSLEYLLSSFYAGQEGSFLFWALCSSIIATVLMPYTQKHRIEAPVMAVFMGAQVFLLALLMVKSPFRSVWEVFPQIQPGKIPADGRGLNPLLQNFWMVIHPPVLFVGFAAMTVPFSFAVAGLWKRQFDILTAHAIPWVLTAVSSLGLGIMLGGYWAYGVLGWGGYWGWDPVENSSLVPWLTGMALIHTLLAQLRTGKFVRTNFLLAVVSFVLVVYSTFLTRSGILGDASVHSFTDPGSTVYWVLLLFLAGMAGMGLILLALRWSSMKPAGSGSGLLTREIALGAGTLTLVLSAVVVLFGTSLPIFSALRVETSFYDRTHIPIAIALGLLIGMSLYMQWEMQDVREILRRSWRTLALSLLVCATLFALGVRETTPLVFIFAALFAVFVNLDIALRVVKGDWRFLGGKIAHIGVGVFLLGVISAGKFSDSQQVALPLGEPQQAVGHTLTYAGSRQMPDGKYAFDVRMERDGVSYTLAPVMFETRDQGVMKNPDIANFLTHDLYLSPVGLDQDPGSAETLTLRKGEASNLRGVRIAFIGFDMSAHGAQDVGGGMAIGALLELTDGKTTERITPVTVYQAGSDPRPTGKGSKLLQADVQLASLNVGGEGVSSTVTLNVHGGGKAGSGPREVLIVDASVKPYINFVWAGTVIMMVGFVLSILKRSKES
jgi:cytochrome c-type biogenesis protein CcmF